MATQPTASHFAGITDRTEVPDQLEPLSFLSKLEERGTSPVQFPPLKTALLDLRMMVVLLTDGPGSLDLLVYASYSPTASPSRRVYHSEQMFWRLL